MPNLFYYSLDFGAIEVSSGDPYTRVEYHNLTLS